MFTPRKYGGLPEKAAGDILCRAIAKQKAARHWKECVSRCCCQVQPGTALGQSVGAIGKEPFVFARSGKGLLEILSGGGRALDS